MPVRSGTGAWKAGIPVKGAGSGMISKGTIIAIFEDGSFPHHTAAGNHAAVYLDHDGDHIRVIDQYPGRHVGERTIPFAGQGASHNNGDRFRVVE